MSPKKRLILLYGVLTAAAVLLLAVLILLPDSRPPVGPETIPDSAIVPSEDDLNEIDSTDRSVPYGAAVPPEPDPESRPSPAAFVPREALNGRLYLVIDDAGYSLSDLEMFLEFPGALTIAVLPHLRYSRETAERAVRQGQEVIIHLPMEPESSLDPGPGAVLLSQTDLEIRERVRDAIESVPGAIGANNHMGSRASADTRVMRTVLTELERHGLFFLDSRTTPATVARTVAGEYGIQIMERDVFLDNEPDKDSIREAFMQGMQIAADKGHAIMIGHLMVNELAEVLTEIYPFVLEEGFDLYHLSDLLPASEDHEDTWN